MHRSLLFTFIANDKPGIVDALSALVARHHGNWLTSRLTRIGGKFTGVVQVSIDEENCQGFSEALALLASQGIHVLLDENTGELADNSGHTLQLSVIGLDRPGIVREIAQALAEQKINVNEMYSLVESAAMSGEDLFKAWLTIQVPASVDVNDVSEQFEAICNRLDIDGLIES